MKTTFKVLGDGIQQYYGNGDTAVSCWMDRDTAEKAYYRLGQELKELDAAGDDEQTRLNQEQELFSHYQQETKHGYKQRIPEQILKAIRLPNGTDPDYRKRRHRECGNG